MDKAQLKKRVNSSGFPQQIGLEAQVKKTYKVHRWSVLHSEHSWESSNTGTSGFIDLILINETNNLILIVECKRVQNTHWIFLTEQVEPRKMVHAKAWRTHEDNGKPVEFGWTDLSIDPPTVESRFCVPQGENKRSKSMLERIASEVVESTKAFAIENQLFHKGSMGYCRDYFSAIVTTADLIISNFDPSKIDVATGTTDETTSKNVSYVRFRKQLSTYDRPKGSWKESTPRDIEREKERTVFIINSSSFIEFLSKFVVE